MTLEAYIHILKSISSPTRFRILNLLYQEKKVLAQWQLVEILEVSKSNISRHAKILRESNLIIQWKTSRTIHYALNPTVKSNSLLMQILKGRSKNSVLRSDLKKLNNIKARLFRRTRLVSQQAQA